MEFCRARFTPTDEKGAKLCGPSCASQINTHLPQLGDGETALLAEKQNLGMHFQAGEEDSSSAPSPACTQTCLWKSGTPVLGSSSLL